MENKFESNTQELKYKVLKAAAKIGYNNESDFSYDKIALDIIPGTKASFRCCVHKERAIIKNRMEFALGEITSDNIVHVIESACDQCPMQRYTVTNACRGCIARSCENSCPVNAIFMVDGRAYINQEKCVECGKCKQACQFNAISDTKRPCMRSCPVDAIDMDENKIAHIDYEKCINCGHCAYNCPFGAITDISYIKNVASCLNKENQKVYALIAPSISSQFTQTKIGQVTKALKLIGFNDVIEVALGADMVIKTETEEYLQNIEDKKIMTTSCCPAFVNLVEKGFPKMVDKMSSTVSPMVALGRFVKELHKDAVTVFIGPCMAKKHEVRRENLKDAIDYAITFEELRSLIGAKDIDISKCEEEPLNNASYFARMFAINGGVSGSIANYIKEQNIDVTFKPIAANGAKECIKNLKIAGLNRLDATFIEGMVCEGGCIGGPGSITHQKRDANKVEKYANLAKETSTTKSLEVIDLSNINMHK